MSDRLWAPWRMQYILGPKNTGCIFCEFSAAPPAEYREKLILAVLPHALVCLNKYPFAASHVLIAPRRHVADFEDLLPEEYDATQRLVREATIRLRRATGAEGLNVGFNLGAAAGAGIADHLHGLARNAGIPGYVVAPLDAFFRGPDRRAGGDVLDALAEASLSRAERRHRGGDRHRGA
jgi:diadenosine tetraphosphate (Ap4A) HIT family hydrolase